MRALIPTAIGLVVSGGIVATAVAGPDRAGVDAELAKSAARVTACGKSMKATYDWRAFDAIDWKTAGKDPVEWVSFERPTVRDIGEALNEACADADVRAMLAEVDTIVYRPTSDSSIHVTAAITGKQLIFTNYTFGSTRDRDDYKSALMHASVPEAKRTVEAAKAAPVVKARVTPSSAWDGKYDFDDANGDNAATCFRADVVRPLTITKGTFSFAWVPGDWPTKVTQLGHVDGAIGATGVGTATITFTDPTRTSKQVTMVKAWRALENIHTMTIHVTKTESGRTVLATVDGESCSGTWTWNDPRPATKSVAKHATKPEPKPQHEAKPETKPRDTKPREASKRDEAVKRDEAKEREESRRREEDQRRRDDDERRRREDEDREFKKKVEDNARARDAERKKEECVRSCDSKQTRCVFKCEDTRDKCNDRCNGDQGCEWDCEKEKTSCQSECRRDSCERECD